MTIDLKDPTTWLNVYGGPLDGSRYYPASAPVPGKRVNLRTPTGDNGAPSPGEYEFALARRVRVRPEHGRRRLAACG